MLTDSVEKKIEWTDAQTKAIEADGENILVSAAAGSGKTAVLVERVIRMLTRNKDPLEIDRLLIITFTRAAAAQMREKIYRAVKKRCEEEPENEHLKRQLMKVHTSHISTIDSLCADIVKENFQDIDIDPGFRIADEAETRLMEKDVLGEIIERHYADPSDDFLRLVDHCTEKNDSRLDDMVLTLYRFAESHPAPSSWLRTAVEPYLAAKEYIETLHMPDQENEWLDAFKNMVIYELEGIKSMAEKGLAVADMNHGPFVYAEPFSEIAEFIDSLEEEPFDRRKCHLDRFLSDWKRSPTVSKNDDVDENLKETAKNLRAEIKKRLQNLSDKYFYQSLEEMFRDMAECSPVACALSGLVTEFSTELSQLKKEKKIADFSDIAHFALKVLIRYDDAGNIITEKDGKIAYTEIADHMAQGFDAIIVDEYQDTNMLQEYLINALSAERFGRPDVFMVGDVKQSIYGFRMACPQLFLKKFTDFSKGTDGRLINLDCNFRSRKSVLDATNYLFERIMTSELGGIEYSHGHGLVYGKGYGTEADDRKYDTELILTGGSAGAGKQSEAYEVALRIEELVSEDGFKYSDIVILSRTTDNPAVEEMLAARGIPLIKSSKKGFFNSLEIRLITDLLSVIDNPYQDIQMAAVLMSPICGMTASDLAALKIESGSDIDMKADITEKNSASKTSLYEYIEKNEKINWFSDKIKEWQRRNLYMELEDFLEYVMEDSGLYYAIAAMPGGKGRIANLDFLKAKAKSFSEGTYKGLFNFIRYIGEIKNADMDFGAANGAPEGTDAVSMMTIHGSKGLEFPVVILINSGRSLGGGERLGGIILDRELGVGLEKRDPETRLKKKTILMETIRYKTEADAVSEELRLLYVAMTRAKEKLIITGNERNLEKRTAEWEQGAVFDNGRRHGFEVMAQKSYLKLLGMIFYAGKGHNVSVQIKEPEDITVDRLKETLTGEASREAVLSMISSDADISYYEREFGYVYPFAKASRIRAKISPSELDDKDTGSFRSSESELIDAKAAGRVSSRAEDNEAAGAFGPVDMRSGAERGTAYHRFLELFDYSQLKDDLCFMTDNNDIHSEVLKEKQKECITNQLEKITASGKLTEKQSAYIDPESITHFLDSKLGQRMKKAALSGKLFRETQFLMGVESDINNEKTLTGIEATSDIPDPELLLVQGVIDAYFEEEGRLILVDYKTDRNINEETLIERYSLQQASYAQALEKMYGRPVDEKYLYSFYLGQAVKL